MIVMCRQSLADAPAACTAAKRIRPFTRDDCRRNRHDRSAYKRYVLLHDLCTLTRCRAIAGRTARCRCKCRYVLKFTAASRGFHCDGRAFELNNIAQTRQNNGVKYVYLLPLNSLLDCTINISDRSDRQTDGRTDGRTDD